MDNLSGNQSERQKSLPLLVIAYVTILIYKISEIGLRGVWVSFIVWWALMLYLAFVISWSVRMLNLWVHKGYALSGIISSIAGCYVGYVKVAEQWEYMWILYWFIFSSILTKIPALFNDGT